MKLIQGSSNRTSGLKEIEDKGPRKSTVQIILCLPERIGYAPIPRAQVNTDSELYALKDTGHLGLPKVTWLP